MSKYCQCGCGQIVNPGNKYILGHRIRINHPTDNPEVRKKISEAQKGKNNSMFGKKHTIETIKKMSKSHKKPSKEARKNMSESHKLTLKNYKEKYPFLFQVEELKEDPKTGNIQGHCKYNKCENSKEKGGWFDLDANKIYHRVNTLYNPSGFGENNFYCSNKCKQKCDVFNMRGDPCKIKNNEKPYTDSERQTLNQFVLERDNYICQFCGDLATDVHHERPVKLEPFFALDPCFAWSCCEKCHYEKGHPKGTECSTGSLANKSCKEII